MNAYIVIGATRYTGKPITLGLLERKKHLDGRITVVY
jgi:hypothetical protein